jgi:F0F1-type ATP synthase membrane subunit b/b'
VSSFFKSRKEKVWKETDDAKKSYEEAMRMLKEIEEKLSQVDNEIEKIVSLNRAIGEKEKKNILEKLKDMIEIIERSGNLEKGIMEKKVRREIVMNIVEQAIKKTKRNLIEKMDVSLHRKINEKSLAALKDAVK